MKISVIIPVHNREAYIATAVESLLRQRDDAVLDIIVVDDGSTDGTRGVVEAIAAQHPCVRLIRQPKTNIAETRNTGLSNVPHDTELVTFLDSDDILLPGRLAADLQLFRADPDLDVTYGLMTLADAIDETEMTPAAGALAVTVRGIHLSVALFRKRIIDAVGGFNAKLEQSEDWDFLLRVFERRPRYKLVDTVAMVYRRHAGNITRNKDQAQQDFRHAILLSAQRRRRDPSLAGVPNFFDIEALYDERYASLR